MRAIKIGKMTIEDGCVLRVTSEFAAVLIAGMTRQRNFNPNHSARIAKDMTDDAFRPRDPLAFYVDDATIADGQHRLRACIMSGKTYIFPVVLVTLEEARSIDVCRVPRGVTGQVKINTGRSVSKTALAALKLESRNFVEFEGRSNTLLCSLAEGVSDELLATLNELRRSKAVCPLNAGVLATFVRIWGLPSTDRDQLIEWFRAVRDNEAADSSGRELHNWLQRNPSSGIADSIRMSVATAKCWRARGKTAWVLRVRTDDGVGCIPARMDEAR